MKIYTRTGDDGTTGLYSGERVPKTDARVEACGAVDELNSVLGAARAAGPQATVDARITTVQRQLFTLGADLATSDPAAAATRISGRDIAWLEAEIDGMTAALPALCSFILPGGTPAAAQIHVARATCRRAERRVLALGAAAGTPAVYLNRLSDFLFTLARAENHAAGVAETEWHPDA